MASVGASLMSSGNGYQRVGADIEKRPVTPVVFICFV